MLEQLMQKFKYTPIHIVLWILVWLFYVYFFSYNSSNQSFVFWFSSSLLPVTIAASYIFSYEIIPKYLLKQHYLRFILYSVYTIIGSLFLIMLIVFFGFMIKAYFNVETMPLLTRNFVFVLILVYLVVGLVSFVHLLRHHYIARNQNKVLQNKILESKLLLKQKELNYLKQQIHPHFLFNTLNTIYASALKNSNDTPELVLKLSNLLDYVLNQIEKPLVYIEDEAAYIESYIGLERVRFKDRLRIDFTKRIKKNVQLPPMLFMAFVENAFKHGGGEDGMLDVNLNLVVLENQLTFEIANTVQPKLGKIASHGIGLENIKNRLETLYPDRHSLEFDAKEESYAVKLQIDLTQMKQNV